MRRAADAGGGGGGAWRCVAGGPAATWAELRDSSTGNGYYYNSATGVTTWDIPADFDAPIRNDAVREKLAGARLRSVKVRGCARRLGATRNTRTRARAHRGRRR